MPTPHHIILSLGSNMGHGPDMLRVALDALIAGGVDIARVSSFYATSPVGPQDQPGFTNAAAAARTARDPHALLALCKQIETHLGRDFTAPHWGPRDIDIDILIFDDLQINTPELTIPHPEIKNRLFVLMPLLEIAPESKFPNGETIKDFAPPHIEALKNSGQKILKLSQIQ